jgi:hypothetical protein
MVQMTHVEHASTMLCFFHIAVVSWQYSRIARNAIAATSPLASNTALLLSPVKQPIQQEEGERVEDHTHHASIGNVS